MKLRRSGRIAALALMVVAAGCQAEDDALEVHAFSLPDAAHARAYLVETSSNVIAIDAGFMPQHARLLLQRADELGKPVTHVLLTHAHVDHYGGLGTLMDAGARPVLTPGVRQHLRDYHSVNYARFGISPAPPLPEFDGAAVPDAGLTIDGVNFTAIAMGPGESYADVVWKVSGPDSPVHYFAGDLVMYGIPPFLQSGHSADWLASLDALSELIANSEDPVLHQGHNTAPEQDQKPLEVIAWQHAQLRTLTEKVQRLTEDVRLLSAEEVQALIQSYLSGAPEIDANYSFILTTSLNVLAAELVERRAKSELEQGIQAIFANLKNAPARYVSSDTRSGAMPQ